MASKKLFGSARNNITRIPSTNTINNAGGVAYDMTTEGSLAQMVVTGTFNGTYYCDASSLLKKTHELADKCSSEFLAKLAVYGQNKGGMKDTPAFLLAKLAARGDIYWLERAFPKVIVNQKMLRNFVQIVRSGTTGRKSFGSAVKKLIQNWLANKSGNNLFKGAVGNSPSLADVVKMVHPKPESKEKEAFYGWLLGRNHNVDNLPSQVKVFEAFKKGNFEEVPDCDFRMITPFLTDETWSKVALKMPWNALRMNLNTFQRHNVFNNPEVTRKLAEKIGNRDDVLRSNTFPYQLLTTYLAVKGKIPMEFSLQLEQAVEYATENIPTFDEKVAVLVDTSGSMESPVTGNNGSATTETKCVDVAGLFASCMLRKSKDGSILVPFDTRPHSHNINPNDSVLKNAAKLARYGGGGTDCACALKALNDNNWKGNLVVYFSDNESWYGQSRYGYGRTGVAEEWNKFKARNPRAKLVCVDLTPNTTTQIPNLPKEVLNVGGFSDEVFEVIHRFVNNEDVNFVNVIKEVEL